MHKLLALSHVNRNQRRDQDIQGKRRKKKNFKGSLWKKNVLKLLALNRNQRRDQELQGRRRNTTPPTRKKKNFKGSLWKKNVHKLLTLHRNQRRDHGRRRNTTLPTRNKTGNESIFVFYLTPRLKYSHLWFISADFCKERKNSNNKASVFAFSNIICSRTGCFSEKKYRLVLYLYFPFFGKGPFCFSLFIPSFVKARS